MHVLRNSAPLSINYGAILPPGEWLVQDDNAFAWGMRAERGTCSLSEFTAPSTSSQLNSLLSTKEGLRSILLIRSGAIGDLLLLTPCIAPLRAKYPNATIHIACFQENGLKLDIPLPMIAYPVTVEALPAFDLIIPLENIVELATDQGIHATTAFAQVLGVTVTDFKPVYKVTEEELNEAKFKFPRGEGPHVKRKPRIGVQLHASSVVRNYPVQLWNAILQQLWKKGWEIMLLGQKDSIPNAPKEVKDCSALSFREAAAVLQTCDVFCGVDSSFFNLCPALGVPAIGLFGSVDWMTRIAEGSGQVALTTPAECAPCGWTNSRGGRQWPDGQPCSRLGYCEPLAKIDPERVIKEIEGHRK